MALVALACGGRTLGDGFEDGVVDPGFGSTGSGAATGSGTTGSGATGWGATGSGATGATGAGGFGATAGTTGVAAAAGIAGTGAVGGAVGAVGGAAGMGGGGGFANTCPTPLLPIYSTIHGFESVFSPDYSAGLYVYTDTPDDDTPWSYGSIYPSPIDDLAAGLTPGFLGNSFQLFGYDFTPGSWGAGVGVYTSCIEASTAHGISFLVKSNVNVRVSVTMPENLPIFDGGECPADYSFCVQNSVDIGGFPEFTAVTLLWEAFTGGRPAAFDPSRIVGVNFQAVTVGGDFSFSIDELEFFFY